MDLVISTFTYTADRDTRIDFSQAYYKATGRLLVKNDGAVQKLSDIAGKKVATTSGSVYDRWMKNCFKNTEVVVTDTFTNAMLAFHQGRADAVMYDDAVLLPVAAADPTAKLTDDAFLEAPFGIGIKQGNTALKAWVDSRLELMQQEGPVPADPEGERPGAVPDLVLEEHPAAEQHVHVRGAGGAERGHRVPVAQTIRGGGRTAASLSPDARATYDLWAFVSRQLGRALPGVRQHDQGLGDRDRGLLRDRARARRGARLPRPGREPAHGRLRRGHPLHADPRADLHDLFRAPADRHQVRPVHRRLAVGDALGRRVQQRELPRRLRRRLAAPP